ARRSAEPGQAARAVYAWPSLGGAEDGSTEGLPLRHEGDWPGHELRRAALSSGPGSVFRADPCTVRHPCVAVRPRQPPAPCPRARVSAEDCTRLTMLFLLW